MLNSFLLFKKNIEASRVIIAVYRYLYNTVGSSVNFDDLLRLQIVNIVSAFDKLMHDLIRIGMVETYNGNRNPTSKYLNENISISLYQDLVTATMPPKEIIFEQAMVKKLQLLTFQAPDKIVDGLSYIWSEVHKWNAISRHVGIPESDLVTRMKLIAERRNAIAHQADINPINNSKFQISEADCVEITDFIFSLGNSIYFLVR